MSTEKFKLQIQKMLDTADVKLNGERPWDIQVKNPELYARVLAGGSLAFGESYMDGWWECEQIDELISRLLSAKLENIKNKKLLAFYFLRARFFNRQTKKKAKRVGEQHYDVGNELYAGMLDKNMNYTCGYWKDADNLDDAQIAKMDLICKKLKLKPGMRLLDIGCGWGSFAKYAAENYQVKVVGVTISKEQVKLAQEKCKGLDVEIRLQDYRDLTEKFDRVISIGMFEHVGYKNYREYMEVTERVLKDDGIMMIHTIGGTKTKIFGEPWINKYIFPGGTLPSVVQIAKAYNGLYKLEDWHNFGPYYDKTLMAWYKNFNAVWPQIANNYDDRFFKMWNYYLLSCAGSFRSHRNQLWQIVFTKVPAHVEYQSVR
jgi:cyclopropane-fatty-acyl-phospholipid synthase